MRRLDPKLYLFPCGWADAADHQETISGGLVFDVGDVGHDHEEGGRRGAPRWLNFGGEGGELDRELGRTKELKDLLELLKNLCGHFWDGLQSASFCGPCDCLRDLQFRQASLALACYKTGGVAC